MYRVIQSTFNRISVVALLIFTACAHNGHKLDNYSSTEQIFREDYEKVWRAAQLALQKYPMRVNNIDKGLLETDWVKGFDIYKPPIDSKISPEGLRYKLFLQAIKGSLKKNPAVKISIQKIIEKQRDFFAEVEKIPSDGLEEKVILYRIDREIIIDNALSLANQKTNN